MKFEYSVNFNEEVIKTIVTNEEDEVEQWLRETLSLNGEAPTIIGLDIETKPTFRQETSKKTATLQLCIDERCLIVQMFHIRHFPDIFRTFLESNDFTFVGVEVAADVEKLKEDYELVCTNHADLLEIAENIWPGRFRKGGLGDLAREVANLCIRKPKHVYLSNWEARELSSEQVRHACIDAYASCKIGTSLI